MDIERLVLGTAQLGTNYGIANRMGKPDFNTAKSIVNTAWESGICEFDTASAYGESEQVLGKVLRSLGIGNGVKIISKFHPGIDHVNQKDMRQAIQMTLSHLKIPKLYGIMLHREEFLDLWDKGLGEILSQFVESGLVKHLGVSVYSPDRAIQALGTERISIVQLPSNLLDRRFEKAGVFRLAGDLKKHIYVRSVFLQGLLLMDTNDVPKKMQFAIPAIKKLDAVAWDTGLSKQDLALGYARQAYGDGKIIIGVDTAKQVKYNTESWKIMLPSGFVGRVRREFGCVEEKILNPALWPK